MDIRQLIQIGLKRTVFRLRNNGTATILCYHGIYSAPPPFPIWIQLSASLFEAHLQVLSRHYRCISQQALVDQLNEGKINGNPVVVTFDDGLASNFHLAFPLLKKYEVPATIYVTANLVGTSEYTWFDRIAAILIATHKTTIKFSGSVLPIANEQEKAITYRNIINGLKSKHPVEINTWIAAAMAEQELEKEQIARPDLFAFFSHLTWPHVDEMLASGLVNIGSHGLNHSILARLGIEEASREIIESKKIIESNTGRTVTDFAYPNGTEADFGAEHRALLQQHGYCSVAIATAGRIRRDSHPLQLPRVCIGEGASVESLEHLIAH
jgi:peptidoglycan/xylan/chitin deacetylase (PgdA/CDA1 family)